MTAALRGHIQSILKLQEHLLLWYLVTDSSIKSIASSICEGQRIYIIGDLNGLGIRDASSARNTTSNSRDNKAQVEAAVYYLMGGHRGLM